MRKALLLLSFAASFFSIGCPAVPAQTQIDLTTQVKGILPAANLANSSLTNTTVLLNNYYQGAYSSTVTYSQGQMVTSSGTTYISLINANLNNTPASSPSDWAAVASGAGGNVTSCSLTTNTIPLATGAGAICDSDLTDISGTLNYSGTNVTFPKITIGNVSSGNYLVVGTDGLGNPGVQFFSSSSGGTTVDATGVYTQALTGASGSYGALLVSGGMTIGLMQNGVPGSPIYVDQAGGGALAMQINGGLSVAGAIQLSNGYGTSGQTIISGGAGAPAAWGAGGGGGAPYPGAGVPNSTGSAWATSYAVGTAAGDLVQLNGSAALPAISGANLTALTAANISSGTAGINISGTAANLTGCAGSAAGDVCYWNGTAWTRLAGNASGTNYLQENASGVPTWAASSTTYPGTGVANSTGSAWGTSYTVGTSGNNLVQLNSGAQLPAVSGALLTNLTAANIASGTANINISGSAATAANLTGCSGSTAGDLCYWNGTAWTRLAGNSSGIQVLQETSSGVPSWAAGGSSMVYPAAGVAYSTGTAWGSSYGIGTSANNLVQLTGAAALPAVSGANLTSLPAANLTGTASVNTTGSAGSLSAMLFPLQTTIASAATIAPGGTGGVLIVTGTATVTTITVPSGCMGTTTSCVYELIPGNGFYIGSGGNIDVPGGVTQIVGAPIFVSWDQNAGSWYPSALGNVTTGENILTATYVPVAYGPYQLVNSLISDNGSTLAYSGASGLDLTGGGGIKMSGAAYPASLSLAAGTGSIPGSLPANSAGFTTTSGTFTSYLIGLPAGITGAGVPILAAPATINGQNTLTMSMTHPEFQMTSGLGEWGAVGLYAVLTSSVAANSGHIISISSSTETPGSGCTTPPQFNAFAANTNSASVTASTTQNFQNGAITTTFTAPGLPFTAGQNIGIIVSEAGSSCATAQMVVTATVEEP